MAQFSIQMSGNAGLYSCEFDVLPIDGNIVPGEIISISDGGLPFEFPVLAVLPHKGGPLITLVCLNWVLPDAQKIGTTCVSKPMKAPERKRYHMKMIN